MNNLLTASQAENLLLEARLLNVAEVGGGLRRTVGGLFAIPKSELSDCTFMPTREPEFGTEGGGR